MPELSKEEFEEKQFDFEHGRKVKSMTETPGWSEIIKPAFDKRRTALVKKMLTVTEYNDFVRLQQSINAIDGLFGFVDGIITLGQEAAKAVAEKKK